MRDADDLDRASDLTEERTQAAIDEVRRQAAPEQVCVNGVWPSLDCVDCGDPIPRMRLQLGRVRCVGCPERLERRRAGL